jgi:hypothetical protein
MIRAGAPDARDRTRDEAVHRTSGSSVSARFRLRRMIEKSRRSVVNTVRMFSRSAR